MKSILIEKIPDETYFRLIEAKGRLKCQTWRDFLTKVAEPNRDQGAITHE